jgi:hypothetical protein
MPEEKGSNQKPDVKFLAAVGVLVVLIVATLAGLWLTERNRRIEAQRRFRQPPMINPLSLPGVGPPRPPARQFTVDKGGGIVVRVREGRYEWTREFANEDEFKADQPALYEEYRAVVERLRRPDDKPQPKKPGQGEQSATAPAAEPGG